MDNAKLFASYSFARFPSLMMVRDDWCHSPPQSANPQEKGFTARGEEGSVPARAARVRLDADKLL